MLEFQFGAIRKEKDFFHMHNRIRKQEILRFCSPLYGPWRAVYVTLGKHGVYPLSGDSNRFHVITQAGNDQVDHIPHNAGGLAAINDQVRWVTVRRDVEAEHPLLIVHFGNSNATEGGQQTQQDRSNGELEKRFLHGGTLDRTGPYAG